MSYGPLPVSPAISRFSFSMNEEEIEPTPTASRPVPHQAWSRSSTISNAQSCPMSNVGGPSEDTPETRSSQGHRPRQCDSKTPVVTGKDDCSSSVSVEKQVTARRFNFVIWLFLLGTVPMLAAAAVVLGLVFAYRVDMQGQPGFAQYYNKVQQDDWDEHFDGYYIDLPVGHLAFASSWASTLAPICATALMGLASFYISKDYMHMIELQKEGSQLPTPYQLALTIQFIDGNPIAAMIRWLRYRRWRHKQDNSRPLCIAMLFALLVLCLSVFVFGADTWLHINIASIDLEISTKMLTNSADFGDSVGLYGFGLSAAFYASDCEGAVNATACCLNRTDDGTYLLNAQQALQILYGTSPLAVVMNLDTSSVGWSWLVNPTVPEVYSDGAYLDVEGYQATAYQAQTYASETTCRLATNECDFTTDSSGQSSFFCSDSFGAKLSKNDLVLEYFTDSSMTSNSTVDGMMPISQPYYFGVAYLSSSVPDWNVSGTNLEVTADGQTGVVMLCNSTTYDMLYTWANNELWAIDTTVSNDTVANLFHAPMQETTVAIQTLMYDLDLALGLVGAGDDVDVSTLDPSEIDSDVVTTFSQYYSAAALAIGAQAVSGRLPINVTFLAPAELAHVAEAPLWLLVAACSMYTLVGAALLAAALLALRDPDVHGFPAASGTVRDRGRSL